MDSEIIISLEYSVLECSACLAFMLVGDDGVGSRRNEDLDSAISTEQSTF